MEAILLAIISTVVFFVILYFVIKAAVRDGIIEARKTNPVTDDTTDDGYSISKKICPQCGEKHDMDYPKCPHCKFQY